MPCYALQRREAPPGGSEKRDGPGYRLGADGLRGTQTQEGEEKPPLRVSSTDLGNSAFPSKYFGLIIWAISSSRPSKGLHSSANLPSSPGSLRMATKTPMKDVHCSMVYKDEKPRSISAPTLRIKVYSH